MAYIGNTVTTQGFVPAVDFFNGNGSTTAFTLSRPVASVAQVQAVVENVPQNPGDAFTVSGNTVTFTSAPPSGTSNIYIYYTSPITQVTVPSQGTVFPSSMSTGGPSWDTAGTLSSVAVRATNGIISDAYTISTNCSIASGDNGFSVGPVTVASGVTVTVAAGSVWTVV